MHSTKRHTPLFVFLHGFMQNGHEWDCVARKLQSSTECLKHSSAQHDAYPILAPTISPTDATQATLPALADTLWHVVHNALDICSCTSCVLVGYSMGGRIALEMARQQPHTLAGLILESAGLGPTDEAERASIAEHNKARASQLTQQGLESFVDYWEALPLFETQTHLPVQDRAAIRAMRLDCNPYTLELLLCHAGAHTMPLTHETIDMLSNAPFPTTYIAGTRDTKYVAIARALTTVARIKLLDAGHNVHREQQNEFVRILREAPFLQ